jgi:outer membrane lipoprotein LolB
MRILLRFCATLCAASLAACTTIGTVAPDAAPAPAFELAGRMVVRYQDRAFSSAVRWKQAAAADEIWLTAPLGQTLAYLQADANGATLTAADQQQYRATSIESLTRSALGWRFPVAGLRYWVLGQPAPQLPLTAEERDGDGRLSRMQQRDWRVAFEYAAADSTRPSRVEVAGAEAQLRLVTDELTLTQP